MWIPSAIWNAKSPTIKWECPNNFVFILNRNYGLPESFAYKLLIKNTLLWPGSKEVAYQAGLLLVANMRKEVELSSAFKMAQGISYAILALLEVFCHFPSWAELQCVTKQLIRESETEGEGGLSRLEGTAMLLCRCNGAKGGRVDSGCGHHSCSFPCHLLLPPWQECVFTHMWRCILCILKVWFLFAENDPFHLHKRNP